MQNKILSFVVNKNGKFLILEMTKHPDHAPDGGWFVVTGGVEEGETNEEAVAREILEETGLLSEDILSLNCGSIYSWNGGVCKENNFIAFVKQGVISLNEEHSNYKWVNLGEFIELIKWDDDKGLLKKVLEKAMNKERYFEELNIIDYRKK